GHGHAVQVLQPEDPGQALAPAPGGGHRHGDERHVAVDDDVGAEPAGDLDEAPAVGGLLADAAHGRGAAERLADVDRDDPQVGALVDVEAALAARVGAAVDVLDDVAAAGERPAEVDLEGVAGEVVHQDAGHAPGPEVDDGPHVLDAARRDPRGGHRTCLADPHRRLLPRRGAPAGGPDPMAAPV